MWGLDAPRLTVSESLTACLSGMTDSARQAAFESERANLIDAEARFMAACEAEATHVLSKEDFKLHGLDGGDAVYLYDERLARAQRLGGSVRAGRAVYDELLAGASGLRDRCPMCNHRIATEIDHFLPKRGFFSLTVCPFNLVPCCKECNKDKASAVATHSDEEFFHPYTIDFDDQVWLKGRVSPTMSPLVEFFIDPPTAWSQTTATRAQAHFVRFRLPRLYTIESANMMNSMKGYLQDLHTDGGGGVVADYLLHFASSFRSAATNCWQAAMLTALGEDPDYCNGAYGFSPA
jgi:hypothetical protein